METCPDCGGRMRIVAAVTESASVKTYLEGVGFDSEIPKLKRNERRRKLSWIWTMVRETGNITVFES